MRFFIEEGLRGRDRLLLTARFYSTGWDCQLLFASRQTGVPKPMEDNWKGQASITRSMSASPCNFFSRRGKVIPRSSA